MSDFTREAELSLTVPDDQIRQVRSQIESGLSDIAVGVDASGMDGGGASGGRQQRMRRQEFRLARERTEHLDDLVDAVENMEGGDGGGGGLLGGVGRNIGVSAVLAGGGIGAGAALAGGGAGLGALSLATQIGETFDEVGASISDAIGDGEGLVQIGDVGSPEITNEVGDITTVVEPQVGDIASPVFRPEFGDFNPSLTVNPEVTADFQASVEFSPRISVNPTFDVELTGLDLGGGASGLSKEIENAIDDVERDLRDEVSTLERRIRNATGGGGSTGRPTGGVR